jgi:hypothetical protein
MIAHDADRVPRTMAVTTLSLTAAMPRAALGVAHSAFFCARGYQEGADDGLLLRGASQYWTHVGHMNFCH